MRPSAFCHTTAATSASPPPAGLLFLLPQRTSSTSTAPIQRNMSPSFTNIFVSAFSPYPSTLSLQLPSDAPALSTLTYVLSPLCDETQQCLSTINGRSISSEMSVASLAASSSTVRLAIRLPGGKGGFGSQLRAAGGRMNSKKNGQNNTDACRDLNGRRLSTIKEAKKLADYLASAPEREQLRIQQTRERLAKLQEEIKRADGEIASAKVVEGSSSSAVVGRPGAGDAAEDAAEAPAQPVAGPSTSAPAGRKRRLDDQKYVQESREMVDNVKSAVAAGGSCTSSYVQRLLNPRLTPFRRHSHAQEAQAGKVGKCDLHCDSNVGQEPVTRLVAACC